MRESPQRFFFLPMPQTSRIMARFISRARHHSEYGFCTGSCGITCLRIPWESKRGMRPFHESPFPPGSTRDFVDVIQSRLCRSIGMNLLIVHSHILAHTLVYLPPAATIPSRIRCVLNMEVCLLYNLVAGVGFEPTTFGL